jgi:hypothetical protein
MKRFTKSTQVQSVIFKRDKWTAKKAQQWLKDHGYNVSPPDSTEEYHRFRQLPPFQMQEDTFRTIPFGKGIKAIIAVPKKNPIKHLVKAKNRYRKISRIPSLLIDLADARFIEIEDDREMKFPLSGNFALCTTQAANEIWILSRKGSKKISSTEIKTPKIFEKFTGYEAENIGNVIKFPAMVLEPIGSAISIAYRSDKFSNKPNDYIHIFDNPPTVSVDQRKKPKIVALRGGKIKVTAEGIRG